jgi:hypothetical protein
MLCRNDRRQVEATLFRHSPSRGRMTKKWVYWERYPGLRPLRGLTRGYYLSPFQRVF